MRKASHDGCDSTSITSGFENEIKKAGSNLMKTKKSSLKRKVQNFSLESDDGVIEPLLQKDKDKTDLNHKDKSDLNQSAKYSLPKLKTESSNTSETQKLLGDTKIDKPSITNIPGVYSNGIKDSSVIKTPTSSATLLNHMNTNVFSVIMDSKVSHASKSPILVDIDTNKQNSSASSLIFTTAKIHADGKNNHMMPVQITPVPILSTIEGSLAKSGVASEHDKSILKPFLTDNNISACGNKNLNTSPCISTRNFSATISLSSTKVDKSSLISEHAKQPVTKAVTCTANTQSFLDKSESQSSKSPHQSVSSLSESESGFRPLSSFNDVKSVIATSVLKLDVKDEKPKTIDKPSLLTTSTTESSSSNTDAPPSHTSSSSKNTTNSLIDINTDSKVPDSDKSQNVTVSLKTSLKRQKTILTEDVTSNIETEVNKNNKATNVKPTSEQVDTCTQNGSKLDNVKEIPIKASSKKQLNKILVQDSEFEKPKSSAQFDSKLETDKEVSTKSSSKKDVNKTLVQDSVKLIDDAKSSITTKNQSVERQSSVEVASNTQSKTSLVLKSSVCGTKTTTTSSLPVKTSTTSSVKTQISTISAPKLDQVASKTKSTVTTKQTPLKTSVSKNFTSPVSSSSNKNLSSSTSKKIK